jgi:hypothetical protein
LAHETRLDGARKSGGAGPAGAGAEPLTGGPGLRLLAAAVALAAGATAVVVVILLIKSALG